ncbi:MAG: amino acid adenylation domain-containing protein, partial [Acidobacteriota bacterium]
AWQRQWLQGEELQRQLDYWGRQLKGIEPLDFPVDHPRSAQRAHRGGVVSLRLTRSLSDALQALSHKQGVTLYMTLLAAFQTLLHHCTGQADVVVGTPIANRHYPDVEKLIGFFVNTLAMRGDLSGDPSFQELLGRSNETALQAYAHQDLPFEKLVELLQPERDLSRSPIFQVMIALQNAPAEELTMAGLEVEPVIGSTAAARFDFSLLLRQDARGVDGALFYDVDLLDRTSALRLTRHWIRLLEGIAQHPDQRLSQFSLLSRHELQQALAEWSGNILPLGLATITGRFAEQSAANPDRSAAVCKDQWLSYGELDERSNQLAHLLGKIGLGREQVVGVCMRRCPEAAIAFLGVLKAGAAYLPLDPGYPEQRLSWMLQDSQTAVRIDRSGAPQLTHDSQQFNLDHAWDRIAAQSRIAPSIPNHPDNAAYLMYTSGSTGSPKGVAAVHRGVVRLVCQTSYLDFSSHQIFSLSSSLSFDASTREIWGSLLNGGRMVIFPGQRPSLPELGRLIRRYGVSASSLTAPLFNQADPGSLENLEGASQLLVGGDVHSPVQAARVLQRFPSLRLVNGYGPTENTTITCCEVMTAAGQVLDPVPIGRPIANCQVYLVDRLLRPVPIGVAGQLCAAGAGLARGYWRHAQRTAQRFVPNPFSPAPGQRFYLTGDRVRWLADGRLQFLGRIDQQVKVRGFRIEPAEIEAALLKHPAIREAAVLALPDPSGGKRLAAYVCRRNQESGVRSQEEGSGEGSPRSALEPAALSSFLSQTLPEYMVPSFFVFLDELPMTPAGKVDIRALPSPDPASQRRHEFVAPRNLTEARLAKVWQEVLGASQVGVYDNFFELGGHSLMATQVLSRIRQAFEMDLPLRILFESPTVARLAGRIEQAAPRAVAAPIRPIGRDGGDLPLSFAQQRLWFLDRLTPGNPFYNIPVAWQLSGGLKTAALRAGLQEVVRRHEVLRTHFPARHGKPVQAIRALNANLKLLAVADLRGLGRKAREAEARRLRTEQARMPFELERGPLLRSLLVRLDSQESLFLLTVHHIVSDGWSTGVLLRELAALYNWQAGDAGRMASSPLTGLPFQYADYAVWQRHFLTGDVLREQLDFWKGHLEGVSTLQLPTDRPRPAFQAFRGGRLPFRLAKSVSTALVALSQQRGVTLYMTLLAAFQALLHRYTGQEDIVVGTPIASRNHPGTEQLIGFFVNALAMRGDLSGNPAFDQLLESASQTALQAFTYQDLPFEKLVEHLQPERDLSRNPVFQVMFALQNLPSREFAGTGLEIRQLSSKAGSTRFDLEVHLLEDSDGIQGVAAFDQDLFDRSTIQRL